MKKEGINVMTGDRQLHILKTGKMPGRTEVGNPQNQAAMQGMEQAGMSFGKMIFTSGKASDLKTH